MSIPVIIPYQQPQTRYNDVTDSNEARRLLSANDISLQWSDIYVVNINKRRCARCGTSAPKLYMIIHHIISSNCVYCLDCAIKKDWQCPYCYQKINKYGY